MTRLWVLNLDAEREMAQPLGPYNPSKPTLQRMKEQVLRLHPHWCGPDDIVVGIDALPANLDRVEHVRCWSPTPSALQQVLRLGLRPPPAPEFDVLRRVNHREFCASLFQHLPGSAYLKDSEEIVERIKQSVGSGTWLLKRPFGFSGSGRRRVRSASIEEADLSWIRASLRRFGGLQVEPWVSIEMDVSTHGFVRRDGTAVIGEPCIQRCDERGAWKETCRAEVGEIHASEMKQIGEAMNQVAAALSSANYFGPFGVDAYRYREGRGVGFQACSEINARYTMGWRVGLGREDIELEGQL